MNRNARAPKAVVLGDTGRFPNSWLPVLIYEAALPVGEGLASTFETRFAAHGWTGSWTNGLFGFHHYHSTAHEVLGVCAGQVRVGLGGEEGESVTLRAGDVLVLPAGVAHKNEEQSRDFRVVGAYPEGTSYDMQYGKPAERPASDENIRRVSLPSSDPVEGKDGPLVHLWAEAAGVT
jgi:uncharacterized protein YjlB